MEGLTDPLMRDILTSAGQFDWCVTEFIRITDTRLPPRAFYAACPELHQGGKTAAGTPVHIQLLGSQPDMLALNAVRAAALGAPAIDLNFGCPAKTVNRHRGGSVLLDEPELIYQIVRAVRQAVPEAISVSAKMRLGYMDPHRALDNALAIEAAGASWLTVHARTKADGYRPPAYWSLLQPIQEALNIKVIANGEIWSYADAQRCQDESGCVDFMLGRGAVTTPDLSLRIRQQCDEPHYSWSDLLVFQRRFLTTPMALSAVQYSANKRLARYKQWLAMMSRHYPEAQQLWQKVKRLTSMEAVLALMG